MQGLQQKVVKLPVVQFIGAQKAGTSAIADWLFDNGDFCRPKVFDNEPYYYNKEVHFFDMEDRYKQGIQFYSKRFQECDSKDFMDATPDTLCFAERVHATYKAVGQVHNLKIIVVLREPVTRELSLYNHLVFDCVNLAREERTSWHNQVINKDDKSIMSFDDFVFYRSIPALDRETGKGRSTRHGLYAKHLRKWFDLFDRKQILVLSYDELKQHPDRVQGRLELFLERTIPGKIEQSNSNDSHFKVKAPSKNASEALHAIYSPLNKKLYKLLESNPGPSMEENPFPKFQRP